MSSQDVAQFVGTKHNIILRSGEHCSKLFKFLSNIQYSIRMSLYIYNNKQEIDKLIYILKEEKYFLGDII